MYFYSYNGYNTFGNHITSGNGLFFGDIKSSKDFDKASKEILEDTKKINSNIVTINLIAFNKIGE